MPGPTDPTDPFPPPVVEPGELPFDPPPHPLRRDAVLAVLRTHAAELERRYHVRPVALFGSVARDEARPGSDVDVLVEYVGPVGMRELFGATTISRPPSACMWIWARGASSSRSSARTSSGTCCVSREWHRRLADVVAHADRALAYVDGMTFDAFAADRRTVDAVTWSVQCVGEAVKHVPAEVRARAPALAWSGAARLRDRIAHGYYAIDPRIL